MSFLDVLHASRDCTRLQDTLAHVHNLSTDGHCELKLLGRDCWIEAQRANLPLLTSTGSFDGERAQPSAPKVEHKAPHSIDWFARWHQYHASAGLLLDAIPLQKLEHDTVEGCIPAGWYWGDRDGVLPGNVIPHDSAVADDGSLLAFQTELSSARCYDADILAGATPELALERRCCAHLCHQLLKW